MGNRFLIILIVQYVVIAGAYFWERDFPRVLYFVGAAILSLGVLWMK